MLIMVTYFPANNQVILENNFLKEKNLAVKAVTSCKQKTSLYRHTRQLQFSFLTGYVHVCIVLVMKSKESLVP